MKTLKIAIVLLLVLSSCDNAKSIRHLLRAANRASEINEGEEKSRPKDYLIWYGQAKDSAGNNIFTALYTLPKDTNMFFLNLSYNMPEKLGFDGKVDSCTVNAFFFKSVADTAGNKFAIQKTFGFTKSGNFYSINTIY
ncbi:MAG: hypothetical protein HC819_19485 [Cyclobacteriaceae bacterium]|nr:hypothetical protein [Cyclobacteriaceae bacterium]